MDKIPEENDEDLFEDIDSDDEEIAYWECLSCGSAFDDNYGECPNCCALAIEPVYA